MLDFVDGFFFREGFLTLAWVPAESDALATAGFFFFGLLAEVPVAPPFVVAAAGEAAAAAGPTEGVADPEP